MPEFPGDSLAVALQELEDCLCGLLGCVQRFSEAFAEMRTPAFGAGHVRARAAISLGKGELGSHCLFKGKAGEAKAVLRKPFGVCASSQQGAPGLRPFAAEQGRGCPARPGPDLALYWPPHSSAR